MPAFTQHTKIVSLAKFIKQNHGIELLQTIFNKFIKVNFSLMVLLKYFRVLSSSIFYVNQIIFHLICFSH